MPTLPYEIVDVFTDRPYAGNPLAVVLGAEGLAVEQLQALAREFNLSETAFPMAPSPSAADRSRSSAGCQQADYRLRIFTPSVELPFAGHPSVGAAHTLARLGRLAYGPVVQECGAGLLPVQITETGARLTGGAPQLGELLNIGAVLGGLGLGQADLADTGPAQVASAGLPFGIVPVRAEALEQVRPDQARLAQAGLSTGVSVVHWDGSSARVRMFAVDLGLTEDPATGSAALALAVWLAAHGLVGEGTTAFRVRQGVEMGRPSTLDCTVTVQDGSVVQTTVEGGVSPVASGEIVVPAAP